MTIDTNGTLTPLSSDGQHYNPIADYFVGTQSAINLGELISDIISIL